MAALIKVILVSMFAVVWFATPAPASPVILGFVPSSVFDALVEVDFKCGLVNGKLVCGKTQGGHKNDDDDDEDRGKGKKKKKDAESELTECTIQEPGSGGGCKGGFKRVCEKMKSGKKCCGCVPDKDAEPPAEKIEDHPCFQHCSLKCSGPTDEARQACVLDCLQSTNCSPH